MKKAISIFAAIVMAGVVMGQDCPCQNQGGCPMQKQGQKAGHGEKSHRAHKHGRRGQKNPEMQKKMEEWKSLSEDERKAKLRERFGKRGQKPEVGEVDIKVFCCAADKKPLTLGGRPNIAPTKNIKFPQWAPKAPKKGHIGKRHNGKRHFSFGPKTQKMAAKRTHFGQKRHSFKAPLMGAKAQKPQFGKRHFSFGPKSQKLGAKKHVFGKRHGFNAHKVTAKRPQLGQKRHSFKAPMVGAKRPQFGKRHNSKRHFTFGQKPQFGRPVQGGFSINPKQGKNPHGAWKRVRGFRH